MSRWLKPLGLEPWDWKTFWRSVDFWLATTILIVPFGLLLLVALRWEPVRVRVQALRRS